MININKELNTPLRTVRGKVELLGSTTPLYFEDSGDLLEFKLERTGQGRFFGYGVGQKVNVKVRDPERQYTITTSNFFNLLLDEFSIAPYLYITETHRSEKDNSLSITAYDKLYEATNRVQEVIPGPYTIREFATMVGSNLGLTVSLPDLECFDTYYEGGANLEGTETIREVLDYIADSTQTIYYINSSNVLVFKRLDKDSEPDLIIDKSMYFDLDSGDNRRLVSICHSTQLGDNVEASLDMTGTTHYVRDNPFWEMREDIDVLVDSALTQVGGFTINQFECKWRGHYGLEIGDKIGLITKDNETAYSYLLDDTLTYKGYLEQKTKYEYEEEDKESSNPSTLGDVLKQTFAKVDKQNKEIQIVASETSINGENISSIISNTENITLSVSETNKRIDDISGELTEVNQRVGLAITQDDLEIAVRNEVSNGVSKVETTTGFTFNEEGLTISKSESDITTTITEDGMTVKLGSKEVLTADNEGVRAIDLHATTYLIIGKNSRFEDYGSKRTGCFWIGG